MLQVRDRAARGGEHVGVGEVELGLVERRARALDLRVRFAGLAGRLERHAQLGLGSANLAARLLARGLRDLEAAHRDRAGIFAVEAFLAVGVALGHLAIGLGHLQRGARALDAGVGRFDGVAREVVGGLGALQRDLVRHGIDVEERLSGLHLVVVADVNLDDLARRLGCDRHHEGLDAGLRGGSASAGRRRGRGRG